MTTPKELADKAMQQAADMNDRGLHATIDQLQAMAEARQGSGEVVALREVGLTRDVNGMCVVTVNGREAIRDNGDVISHFATLDWFASPSAQQATGSGHVLTGWKFEPADGSESLIVRREGLGGYAAKKDDQNIASTILYHLASDVLAAATQAQPEVHPDDTAVDAFAQAMKDKLAAARAKGRGGWQGCSPNDLSRMLREHVEKGDPRDVANFCMFLWHMGAAIAKPTGQVQPESATTTPIQQQQASPSEWVERAMSLADFAAREAYRAGDYADSSYTNSSHETLRALRAHLESRDTQAQPVIHAQFECVSDTAVGVTSAPIKRVEQNDDGSFTVTIDHWPTAQPEVPAGWKLVPVEPTPKMVAATWYHPQDTQGTIESQNARNTRIYAAMLAAAPTTGKREPLTDGVALAGLRGELRAAMGFVLSYIEEARGALNETYRFASTAPRAQQNINAALEMLDEIEALQLAAPTTGKREPLEHRLFDSQWVNVVNAPEVLNADDAQAAVAAAVKLTERAMAKNIAADSWPAPKGT